MLLISLLQIRDGIVIYVCFYKGATEKIIHKMGKYNDINDSIINIIIIYQIKNG